MEKMIRIFDFWMEALTYDIISHEWRKGWVRHHTVEGPIKLLRNLTSDLQIEDLSLEAIGRQVVTE